DARERTGDPVNAAYGSYNIGEILCDQGRLEEAESLFRKASRVWRAAGDRSGAAYVESQLGRIAARTGRFDEALLLLSHAGAELLDIGDRGAAVEAGARTAECLLLHGRSDAALAAAQEALGVGEIMGEANVQAAFLHRVR